MEIERGIHKKQKEAGHQVSQVFHYICTGQIIVSFITKYVDH